MSNLDLIKLLLPYMRPYLKQIIFVLLMLPLASITYAVQPIIIQKAIDGPLLQGSYQGLWIYVLVLISAVVLNFIIQVVQFWLINTMGQNVVANVRAELFAHLEQLSMSFFDRTPVGRSVSRLTSDMEQLAESFAGGLILIILDAFNIMGILFFMFYLNWHLSLLVSLFLIPIYFITIYYQDLYRKANMQARKELSKLNSFLQQNVVGISVVQVLNSTAKSMQKFAENNKKYFKANDQSIRADAQLSATIELVSLVVIAGLILVSKLIIADSFIESTLTIGVLLAFLQYAQSLFEPIRNLSDRFTVIQSAFTAAERVNQLMSEPVEIKDPNVAQGSGFQALSLLTPEPRAPSPEPLIEFQDVWFKYKTDTDYVLKDFNLQINKGDKVAIIGRTGSGKSTIIKLLTRLYEAERGSIKVNGIDIKDIRQSDLRKMISVIHQDSYIFAGDLESNIRLGRDEDLDMVIVEPLLSTTTLSMDTVLSERAGNISAGEEQVISFARALVGQPKILVLDEATAKIDVKTEKAIHNLMEQVTKDKTVIIIAHRLETIKNADHIYEIKEGKAIK